MPWNASRLPIKGVLSLFALGILLGMGRQLDHSSAQYMNPFTLQATGTCNNKSCSSNTQTLCTPKSNYHCEAVTECSHTCNAC